MPMKRLILPLLFCALLPVLLAAQSSTPPKQVVKWTLKVDRVDDRTVDLIADATVDDGWYIYSRFLAPDEGPIPTSFEVEEGASILSRREEGNKHEVYDPIFEMLLVKFSKDARFVTRVRVPAAAKTLTGSYTYMSCDETKCLPPIRQKFTVDLP